MLSRLFGASNDDYEDLVGMRVLVPLYVLITCVISYSPEVLAGGPLFIVSFVFLVLWVLGFVIFTAMRGIGAPAASLARCRLVSSIDNI